jgi:hypothetical protein
MKFLILALVTLSLLVGCDDSKSTGSGSGIVSPTDGIPVVANKFTSVNARDLLVSGKLKFAHVFTNMKEDILPDCSLDDRFEFLANGNYIYTVNQPCGNNQKDDTGTWTLKLRDGKTFLNTISNNEESELEIIRVDPDGLTMTEVSDGERFTASLILAK